MSKNSWSEKYNAWRKKYSWSVLGSAFLDIWYFFAIGIVILFLAIGSAKVFETHKSTIKNDTTNSKNNHEQGVEPMEPIVLPLIF